MQSLFPSLPRNAGPAALLQFKAGKCNMTQQPNGKYLVSPDLRKGTLTLVRGTDGVLHVKWTDRGSNVVVDDIIVFPNETEFKKVKTGVDADRVYVLKWKTNAAGANVNRRYIFWMQLKDSSLDEENVKKVNEELNRTAPAVSAQQSQWMQMMGLAPPGRNAAPSAAAPVSSAATTAPATMNMDFASLLSGLPAAPATTTAAATLPPAAPAMNSRTSLQSLLSSEAVTNSGIFDDEQAVSRLVSYLPEAEQPAGLDALRSTLHSPQLQQAMDALAEALNSDNFNSILSSFNIDPAPGMAKLMAGDAVGALVDCIKAESEKRRAAATSPAP